MRTAASAVPVLHLIERWERTLFNMAAAQTAVEVISPFRAIPGRAGELVGFDYALPVDRLDGQLRGAVAALRLWYRARRERLRIEFNEASWPGLAPALEQAGLVLEGRHPLLACDPETFRPTMVGSVRVRLSPADPRFPSTYRASGEIDGATAGLASIGVVDGVAELYGVITQPAYRRRGIAGILCSALIQGHFKEGGTLVFLDAENPAAQRLYERLGFRPIGSRLAYAEPEEPGWSQA